MTITTESYGHAAILNIKGDLNEDALNAVKQAVDHQVDAGEAIDVVFNMAEVGFVDSAGLEYLLALQDRLAEKLGQVKMVNLSESVRMILEITRLQSRFEAFDDIPSAVKALEP